MLDMFHCAHITFYVLEYFFALQSDQIFAALTGKLHPVKLPLEDCPLG